MTVAQGIEQNVRRLKRGLALDPTQEARLRQILMDQHKQILKLRSEATPSTDVAATTLAIFEQTKTRIRELLNDEQKTKYSAEVPRESLAPAQANLDHYMSMQEAQRRLDQSKEASK